MIRRFKKPISTRPILTLVPNLSPTASATFLPMKLCTDGVCVSIARDLSKSTNKPYRDVEKPFNSCHINNYEVQNYKFFLTYTEIYLFFFRCLRFFEYFCISFLESIGIKTDVYKNTLIYLLVWQM